LSYASAGFSSDVLRFRLVKWSRSRGTTISPAVRGANVYFGIAGVSSRIRAVLKSAALYESPGPYGRWPVAGAGRGSGPGTVSPNRSRPTAPVAPPRRNPQVAWHPGHLHDAAGPVAWAEAPPRVASRAPRYQREHPGSWAPAA